MRRLQNYALCAAFALVLLAGTATNRDTEADELVAQDVVQAPVDAVRLAQAEELQARRQHASASQPTRRRYCQPSTEACER